MTFLNGIFFLSSEENVVAADVSEDVSRLRMRKKNAKYEKRL